MIYASRYNGEEKVIKFKIGEIIAETFIFPEGKAIGECGVMDRVKLSDGKHEGFEYFQVVNTEYAPFRTLCMTLHRPHSDFGGLISISSSRLVEIIKP